MACDDLSRSPTTGSASSPLGTPNRTQTPAQRIPRHGKQTRSPVSTPSASPILTGKARRKEGLMADASRAEAMVEAVFREEWGRIVASLIAMTGDWDLAEECAQDAFTRALQTWDRDGVPARPGAWLTTVARNRAVDVLRRRANEAV